MSSFLIVIPTYNEIDNISKLLEQVFAQVPQNTSVLIVDDNSPDGTGAFIDTLIQKNSYHDRLYILHRTQKQGLGKAYIAGFQWGIDHHFDYFISMDADFSHNPIYLPHMMTLLEQTQGCVIGSRYVKSGGTQGWGLVRKIISYGGSLYARLVLWTNIHDFTGGFNGYTQKNLIALNLPTILSSGYCFQIEMKFRHHLLGQKITEFPIIFADRTLGRSKMSGSIFKEAVLNVLKLSLTRHKIKQKMKDHA